MLTKFLRTVIRVGEVGLAATVAGALFGPVIHETANNLLRQPVAKETSAEGESKRTSAVQPSLPLTTNTPTILTPSPLAVHTHSVPLITDTPTLFPSKATDAPTVSPSPSSTASATPTSKPTSTPEPTHSSGSGGGQPTSSPSPTATAKPTGGVVSSTLAAAKRAAVITFARARIGLPYIFGGMSMLGYDCSGLTKAAFASVGINIGTHSSNNQFYTAQGKGYLVPYADRKPGDLIFYEAGGDYYHVTIYSGNGMMIEAAHPGTNVREVPVRSADRVAQVARFIR